MYLLNCRTAAHTPSTCKDDWYIWLWKKDNKQKGAREKEKDKTSTLTQEGKPSMTIERRCEILEKERGRDAKLGPPNQSLSKDRPSLDAQCSVSLPVCVLWSDLSLEKKAHPKDRQQKKKKKKKNKENKSPTSEGGTILGACHLANKTHKHFCFHRLALSCSFFPIDFTRTYKNHS